MRALALALLLLFVPATAAAQDEVQRAAEALRGDPVYVDPDAELADQVDAAALRERIDVRGAAPMFIAVLPESAIAGSAGRTLIALREAVGREGTYALAIGDEFRTLSDDYDAAEAGDAARAAHPDDLQATLLAFIDETGSERSAGGGAPVASILAIVVLGLVALGGLLLIVGRKRSRDGRSEVGEIDQQDDFIRLGDGIRALELDVTLGDADSAVKADYDRAVDAYDRANTHQRRGETAAADQALDEGLAAITSARERLRR